MDELSRQPARPAVYRLRFSADYLQYTSAYSTSYLHTVLGEYSTDRFSVMSLFTSPAFSFVVHDYGRMCAYHGTIL